MANGLLWNIKSFEEISTIEFHQILKTRINVFVVEQTCPYPELDGDDPQAIHLWATHNNEVVAYCRIFKPGIKYAESSIGRVCTSKGFRGQNIGRSLMKIAIGIIESRFKTTIIRISAQDYLLRFYSELGFAPSGINYLEDNIPHTEMFREK